MSLIELTQGRFAVVDDEDYEVLSRFNWCFNAGYAYTRWPSKKAKSGYSMISMHRFLLGAPHGKEVDHINNDGIDNRRENLRLCTRRQNCANTRTYKNKFRSKYRGVARCQYKGVEHGGWQAHIRVNGKLLYLGTYKTPEEAAEAFDKAATKYNGEFAKLNFVGAT